MFHLIQSQTAAVHSKAWLHVVTRYTVKKTQTKFEEDSWSCITQDNACTHVKCPQAQLSFTSKRRLVVFNDAFSTIVYIVSSGIMMNL